MAHPEIALPAQEAKPIPKRERKLRADRVLVIEDEALIGQYMALLIADLGHQVCAIESTESAAVASATQWKPDLMIVDARLRSGSGVAAVEQILRTGFVPHVFVSGSTLKDRKLDARAMVLRKPFRNSELDHAIQRALGAAANTSATPP